MRIKATTALIALALSGPLYAGDWYLGGGAGVSIGHDMADLGSDADKNGTAWTLFTGYNFTENFGGELGYLNTGTWSTQQHDFKTDGATLSAIGRLPLNDIFSVFAEGGGYLYTADTLNGSETNLAPLAGLGMTARLSDWLDLQARYRYLVRIGDDARNDNNNSGTERWVTNASVATLELVAHPTRSAPVAPVPPPAMIPHPSRLWWTRSSSSAPMYCLISTRRPSNRKGKPPCASCISRSLPNGLRMV